MEDEEEGNTCLEGEPSTPSTVHKPKGKVPCAFHVHACSLGTTRLCKGSEGRGLRDTKRTG